MIARLLAVSFLIFSTAVAHATDFSGVERAIQTQFPKAHVGVLIQRLDENEPIFARHANELFYPASVTKLFTSLAAWERFGPAWAFVTQIETTGLDIEQGTADRVILRLSGDPSFTGNQLNILIRALAKQGIKSIKQDFILETSSMEGPAVSNFMVEDLPWYFAAPGGALVLDKNRWGAYIEGEQLGSPAFLSPSSPASVVPAFQTRVELAPTDITETICPLEAQVDEQNTLTLRGCWPAERNGALLRFAYTNPEAHFKTQVLSLLKKHNITLKGSVVQSSVSAIETNLIMALRGEPLTHLLEDVIQMSDNVVADNLFRQYGGQHFSAPGSLARGKVAMGEYIAENLMDDSITLFDGSGSSRYNLFTPQLIHRLLSRISTHEGLVALFPQMGVSEKMKSRPLPSGWTMRAKTGSATSISALAGFLSPPDSDVTYSVVIVINQAGQALEKMKPREDKVLHAIIEALA